MKYQYICLECLHLFDQPEQYVEKHGLDTMPFETFYICPNCGSTWFAPSIYCDLCHEVILDDYIVTADEVVICTECYTERNVADA